jgi:hypothetical protein
MTKITWSNAKKALVGKSTLIELKHVDALGKDMGLEHAWGIIESVDRKDGILIELLGVRAGQKMALPAEIETFQVARPGLYRLETTGEEIESPDYYSVWTITHTNRLVGAD